MSLELHPPAAGGIIMKASEHSSPAIVFESRGTKKFLARQPGLKEKIEQALLYQQEKNFFKTKSASRIKWHGQPVYEIRVNDPSVKALRAAFTRSDGEIHVVYLTTTLLKKDFTKEMDGFLREENG